MSKKMTFVECFEANGVALSNLKEVANEVRSLEQKEIPKFFQRA